MEKILNKIKRAIEKALYDETNPLIRVFIILLDDKGSTDHSQVITLWNRFMRDWEWGLSKRMWNPLDKEILNSNWVIGRVLGFHQARNSHATVEKGKIFPLIGKEYPWVTPRKNKKEIPSFFLKYMDLILSGPYYKGRKFKIELDFLDEIVFDKNNNLSLYEKRKNFYINNVEEKTL